MGTTVTDTAGLPTPVALAPDERRTLLDLARVAVAVASRAAPPETLERAVRDGPAVRRRAAAFVTLEESGELRGCMGVLDAGRPVTDSVVEAAACAARTDPRFMPVSPAELDRIDVEVSILGPMTRLSDPLAFRPGIDGVIVEKGGRRGLLLPEVAPTVGNDRIRLLEICCRKAGLPPGAWRDPLASVHAFRTERFGGSEVSEALDGGELAPAEV